jgi:hypothetical protein
MIFENNFQALFRGGEVVSKSVLSSEAPFDNDIFCSGDAVRIVPSAKVGSLVA